MRYVITHKGKAFRFPTEEAAKAAAEAVFQSSGMIVGIETQYTVAEVKAELAALGITFRKNEWSEFRVTFRPPMCASKAQLERLEGLASYTNDLTDALMTGLQMAKHRAAFPDQYVGL
jgi:hypothetical protein